MIGKFIILAFLGGLSLQSIAQTPAEMEALQKKYKGEKAVIINDAENVIIDIEKDTYKITEFITKETLLLDNSSLSAFANEQVYDSYFLKLKEIEAKTLIPSGSKYKSKNVEKFVDSNNQSGSVFYDEVITRSFVFPALQEGAITSLKYTREVKDPLFIGSFFFKWYTPCEISTISIKADKRASIKYKLFNAETFPIEFTTQEKGKYIIYTWTAKNIKAAKLESNTPGSQYYLPHIVYYIDNPDLSVNLRGLDALYNHYLGYTKNLNLTEDTIIKREVDRLTKGAQTEEEKVKRVFYWVQDNINYVAFEHGLQGFIPEPAVQVFNKRYGDCKGMSSLLQYMLRLAGIKSHLTWVGTRSIPYKYTEIPSQSVDNHMIVTYFENNNPIFLDATSNHLQFGYPSSMIQGKQVLVSIDHKNYKVEEVPVLSSDKNVTTDSVLCKFKGNLIEGTGLMTLTGYNKSNYTSYLSEKDPIKSKEYVSGTVIKGNNKFFLDTFSLINLHDRELPLRISYTFHLSDYFRQIGDEIFINMNLSKIYNNYKFDKDKREAPFENEQNSLYKLIVTFDIPEGYKVSYLPASISGKTEKFSFKINYNTKNNQVILTQQIEENFLLLESSDFEQWNKSIEKLSQAYRDVLIFKKQ